MAKVIATSNGYFGGEYREIGSSFGIPDDLWNDMDRRPKWVRLDPAAAAKKPTPLIDPLGGIREAV